jgi:PHD/YefM family antitoxin component YafN of YafNO toxin-antitoxin module
MNVLADKQFILDPAGKPVAVVLDIACYERLCEAAEDAEDRAAFEAALPEATRELAAGECVDLDDYLAARKAR